MTSEVVGYVIYLTSVKLLIVGAVEDMWVDGRLRSGRRMVIVMTASRSWSKGTLRLVTGVFGE